MSEPIGAIGKKSYSIASDIYKDFKAGDFSIKKEVKKICNQCQPFRPNSVFDGNLRSSASAASAQ